MPIGSPTPNDVRTCRPHPKLSPFHRLPRTIGAQLWPQPRCPRTASIIYNFPPSLAALRLREPQTWHRWRHCIRRPCLKWSTSRALRAEFSVPGWPQVWPPWRRPQAQTESRLAYPSQVSCRIGSRNYGFSCNFSIRNFSLSWGARLLRSFKYRPSDDIHIRKPHPAWPSSHAFCATYGARLHAQQ